MDEVQEGRSVKRILVLGSAPHSRLVTAYAWDNLPIGLDVADYQIVILNFASLKEEALGKVITTVTPPWEQFARLLFSEGGEVLAIGAPGSHLGDYHRVWWLPVFPQVVFSSGLEIRDIDPEFSFYFEQVRQWFFHATPSYTPPGPTLEQYVHLVYPGSTNHQYFIAPIAQTRFDHAIAFKIQLRTVKSNQVIDSGNAIWLPPTTEISHQEAVNLILRQRYGIGFEQTSPDWLKEYKLPRQVPIEAQIASYRDEIHRLTDGLKEAQHRLQHESRFQKLLFEQGEDGLESAVRDALRDLGAKVDDPQ